MPSANKRSGAAWPALANATLGCWLFLSPFFLGHEEEMTSSLNAYITGALIMVLAGYAGQSKDSAEDKAVAFFALWLVASPWVLGFSQLTEPGSWNAVVTGIAVLACAAWSLAIKRGPLAPSHMTTA